MSVKVVIAVVNGQPQLYSYNEDFWKDRAVLVTGATGLLGSWLSKYLIDLKALPVFLVRDWVPESELVRGGYIKLSYIM